MYVVLQFKGLDAYVFDGSLEILTQALQFFLSETFLLIVVFE